MDDKLRAIEERFEHLAAELADPDLIADRTRYQAASRAYSEIEPVVEAIRARRRTREALDSAREMLAEAAGDPEMQQLAREEIVAREEELEELSERLRLLMLPKDPNDEKNVILEVRAGTGGDEATLFAAELLRAYLRYAEARGWKARVVSSSESGLGGVKEAIVDVQGRGAYSRLKHESGVHRVQRVPQTESSGRIHTSAASVAVLPEAEEVEVEIEDKDLRVDLFCSSGPGGQSVNTTQSAVRLTHLPSGIVVSCQDEKSQHANRASALKVLRARLLERKQREQHEAIAADRKSMVGSGDRSEKIRTYNFPQGRVTDHRVPVTVHRIDAVMSGELDLVLDPVIEHFQAERLKES
jgi:peptide chain release factor 1